MVVKRRLFRRLGLTEELPRSMRYYLYGNFILFLIGLNVILYFNPQDTFTLGAASFGTVLSVSGDSLQSIGSAIVASAIVGFVYFGYMYAEKRYDKAIRMADEWALIDIFADRQDESKYKPKIVNARDKIDIQAITSRNLYLDLGEEIEDAGRRGVQIRILLIDPESPMCDWIETAHDGYGDLGATIENSVNNYTNLDTDNITIRYYDGLPVNYFRIDDWAFFGPYFTEDSRNTDTMLADTSGKLADSYRINFEDFWSNYSRPIN